MIKLRKTDTGVGDAVKLVERGDHAEQIHGATAWCGVNAADFVGTGIDNR